MASIPNLISGFREIAEMYDVVLFDQYGVLHNGKNALGGSVEVLEKLHVAQKKMVVLSNSSQRRDLAISRFNRIGLPSVMTAFAVSGEVTWNHIRENYLVQKKRCLWLTWSTYEKDDFWGDLWDEMKMYLTQDVELADYILIHGPHVIASKKTEEAIPFEYTTVGPDGMDERLRAILKRAAEKGLPAVCANPDVVAVQPEGNLAYMPGGIADEYDKLLKVCGNDTSLTLRFGKPSADMFRSAVTLALDTRDEEAVKVVLEKNKTIKVLHVGDSLHHDVLGAHNAQIDCLFVAADGVHKAELYAREDEEDGKGIEIDLVNRIHRLAEREGIPPPKYTIPSLIW